MGRKRKQSYSNLSKKQKSSKISLMKKEDGGFEEGIVHGKNLIASFSSENREEQRPNEHSTLLQGEASRFIPTHFSSFSLLACRLTHQKTLSIFLIDLGGHLVYMNKLGHQHLEGSLNNFDKKGLLECIPIGQQREKMTNMLKAVGKDGCEVNYFVYSKNARRRYGAKGSDKNSAPLDIFYRYFKCLNSRIKPIKMNLFDYTNTPGFWNNKFISRGQNKYFLFVNQLSSTLPTTDLSELHLDPFVWKHERKLQVKKEYLSSDQEESQKPEKKNKKIKKEKRRSRRRKMSDSDELQEQNISEEKQMEDQGQEHEIFEQESRPQRQQMRRQKKNEYFQIFLESLQQRKAKVHSRFQKFMNRKGNSKALAEMLFKDIEIEKTDENQYQVQWLRNSLNEDQRIRNTPKNKKINKRIASQTAEQSFPFVSMFRQESYNN